MKKNSGQLQLRALALGGITGAFLVGAVQTGMLQAPRPVAAYANPQEQIHREVGTFARLARTLKPSVVNIAVEKNVSESAESMEMLPFPFPRQRGEQFQRKQRGQGSGVIISEDGYILTNNHVVEGVKTARVTLSTGEELSGTVVGTDPQTDIALIKVKPDKSLPAAPLGDSSQLEVGDWVMAIGNPFGLDATVTVGVLSGKGRVIGAGLYDDFLQTDASINPGNSGGPLFNTSGQVVGINTAIIPNGQGIGFSIPVNMARDIVAQLKAQGRVVRGFLGVGIQPLTPRLKSALKIPADVQGALISSLVESGPARKAGVQVQDIVTSVNGKPVRTDRELLAEVARTPVGQKADLTIWRGGRNQQVQVTVVERPDDQVSQAPVLEDSHERALGLSIESLTPEIAQQLTARDSRGVVVMDVAANSPAAQAGLRRGDIIHKINDAPVTSSQEFLSTLKQAGDGPLAFFVERQGETVYVTMEG